MDGTELLVLAPDPESWSAALRDLTPVATSDPAAAPRRARTVLAAPDLGARWLATGGRCEWLQSTWAGVEPLLPVLPAETRLSRPVGVFGAPMARYVLGVVLADAGRFDDYAALQQARRWEPLPPRPVAGRCMTVAGAGDIGAAVARRAATFGMRTVGLSRTGRPVEGFDAVLPFPRAREVLPETDWLVAVLPGTPATRALIDAAVLGALPRHALVVNVGRAATLDHGALCERLRDGRLRGAVLDVLPEEPLPPEDPLWRVPGLRITPHVAAPSLVDAIAGCYRDNRTRFLAGAPLAGEVDRVRGY